MALTKEAAVDKIEVTEGGYVQVRTATRIVEDGNVISQSYHRHVICPGDDYSAEDPKVKAVCSAVHTPEAIEAHMEAQANG